MSRHVIPGKVAGTEVIIGWDQPMMTFFVQVYQPTAARGVIKHWLGGNPRELYELDDLKRAIRPHAFLSQEMLQTLYADRDEGRME